MRWTDDAEQLILKIPRTRLESHLADLVGRPVDKPVDFRFGFSTATGRGRSLLAAVEFLARELDRPGGIAETPLAREQLEAFVMTQVLLAVPNSYSDVLEGYVARSRPSRLQAVLAHMETHADQPLTPGELARVGCMSVRSLHATFQHELGVSPMAHLRRIRLDHVHAELLRAASRTRASATSPCAGGSSTRAGSPASTTSGSASSPPTRQADHAERKARIGLAIPRTSRSYFSRSPPHLQGWPCWHPHVQSGPHAHLGAGVVVAHRALRSGLLRGSGPRPQRTP